MRAINRGRGIVVGVASFALLFGLVTPTAAVAEEPDYLDIAPPEVDATFLADWAAY